MSITKLLSLISFLFLSYNLIYAQKERKEPIIKFEIEKGDFELKTFNSKTHSLQYPSTWKKFKGSHSEVCFTPKAVLKSKVNKYFNCLYFRKSDLQIDSLGSVINTLKQDISIRKNHFSSLNYIIKEQKDNESYKYIVDYTFTFNTVNFIQRDYIYQINSNLKIVTFIMREELFPYYQNDVDLIINSLVVK